MTRSEHLVTIRPLRPEDDRSGFSCGNVELDRFFRNYAGQNQFKTHLGVTYVAVNAHGLIHGFVTVSSAEVVAAQMTGDLVRKMPRYPQPAVRLSRMGVSTACQGQGIGLALVNFVFDLAHDQADRVGCVAIVVDAKDTAKPFYESLGFLPLVVQSGWLGDRPAPTPMFIWLQDVPRRDPSAP